MERRLLGKRVWVVIDGQRRRGTVSSEDDLGVVIRENAGRRVTVLPKTAEGKRWGLLLNDEEGPKTPGSGPKAT